MAVKNNKLINEAANEITKKIQTNTTQQVAAANALAAAQAAAAAQSAQAAQRAATNNKTTTQSTAQQHLQNKINAGIVAAPTAKQQAVNNVTPATTTKSTYTSGSNQPNATQTYNTPTVGIVNLPTAATPATTKTNNTTTTTTTTAPTVTVTPTVTPTVTTPSVSYSGSVSSNTYTPSTVSSSHYEPAKAEFKPSQEYLDAMAYANELLAKLSEGRTQYTDRLESAIKAVEDTRPFSYDFNTDPLFQAQLAAAMRDGQIAMRDTMGQAAALTGGYGSTYGQGVASQAYLGQVQKAYDNLPEYYGAALDTYNSDLNNKYKLADLMNSMDSKDWAKMVETYGLNRDKANDIYDKEYSNYWQTQNFNEASRQFGANFDENSRQWADEFNKQDRQFATTHNEKVREYDTDDAYRRERAQRSDYEWDTAFDYQKERDGVSDAQWLKNYNLKASSSDSGSTGSTGTTAKAKTISSTLQKQIENKVGQTGITGTTTDRDFATNNKSLWSYLANLANQGYDIDELFAIVDSVDTTPQWSYGFNGFEDQFGNIYSDPDAHEWKLIGYDESKKQNVYQNKLGVEATESDLEALYGEASLFKKGWKANVIG